MCVLYCVLGVHNRQKQYFICKWPLQYFALQAQILFHMLSCSVVPYPLIPAPIKQIQCWNWNYVYPFSKQSLATSLTLGLVRRWNIAHQTFTVVLHPAPNQTIKAWHIHSTHSSRSKARPPQRFSVVHCPARHDTQHTAPVPYSHVLGPVSLQGWSPKRPAPPTTCLCPYLNYIFVQCTRTMYTQRSHEY